MSVITLEPKSQQLLRKFYFILTNLEIICEEKKKEFFFFCSYVLEFWKFPVQGRGRIALLAFSQPNRKRLLNNEKGIFDFGFFVDFEFVTAEPHFDPFLNSVYFELRKEPAKVRGQHGLAYGINTGLVGPTWELRDNNPHSRKKKVNDVVQTDPPNKIT